jgi:hypothetical protein
MEISEERIIAAIMRGDIGQLHHWGCQGVHVSSEKPLLQAVWLGRLGMVQCLVRELGADVDQESDQGITSLHLARPCIWQPGRAI